MDDVLFDKWTKFLFDRDKAKGDWRFELDAEFEIPETSIASFICKLNASWPQMLAKYDNWQLGHGVTFIYQTSSAYINDLRDGKILLKDKIEAMLSIKKLFSDCFAPRCKQVLGNKSEESDELGYICYMLWEETCLSYCERNPDKDVIYAAVSEVMESALHSENIACIESGLHGLGHLTPYFPKAKDIIQSFIDDPGNANSRLMEYAKAAKKGNIQ